jgi:hypothetical protein
MPGKICKLCKKRQSYANSNYCYTCIKKREKEKKLEKELLKKERKESTKKFQESLRKTLHNKAWKLMSEYIRRKDADWKGNVKCYTCYKTLHWKEAHCSHRWHGRLDFDERNQKPCCVKCNTYLSGNLGEYERHLITDHGLDWSNQLKSDANTHQGYSISDLKAIIGDLKQKIDKLSTN